MITTSSSSNSWSFLRVCGLVGFICSAWNLFGDLYFLDFYKTQLSFDEFGMIREDFQSQGYLFQFNKNNWWVVFLAQSGGWMYPIWAFVTAVPLYIGLQKTSNSANETTTTTKSFWKGAVPPCALITYGLCVVGGALHSAFAFLTVLPSVYHYDSDAVSDLKGTDQFSLFLQTAQRRVIQHIMFGCLPGYIACNVAGIWIAILVHFGNTKLPKTFNFFNPIVTMFWVQILGTLLPDPCGFYLVGCLGTWGLLFFNIGTTYYLWNEGFASLESLSTNLLLTNLLLLPKGRGGFGQRGEKVDPTAAPSPMDYKSVEH